MNFGSPDRPEGSSMPQDSNAWTANMKEMKGYKKQIRLAKVLLQMSVDAKDAIGMYFWGTELGNAAEKAVRVEGMEAKYNQVIEAFGEIQTTLWELNPKNKEFVKDHPEVGFISKLPTDNEFYQRLKAVKKEYSETLDTAFLDVCDKLMRGYNTSYEEPFADFHESAEVALEMLKEKGPGILKELRTLQAQLPTLAGLVDKEAEILALREEIAEVKSPGEVHRDGYGDCYKEFSRAVKTMDHDISSLKESLRADKPGGMQKTSTEQLRQRVVQVTSDVSAVRQKMAELHNIEITKPSAAPKGPKGKGGLTGLANPAKDSPVRIVGRRPSINRPSINRTPRSG